MRVLPRCCRNSWQSIIDGSKGYVRPVRHGPGGGRGPRAAAARRRALVFCAATALVLAFVSLKQAPQPEWQGFVKVRGLQVCTIAEPGSRTLLSQDATCGVPNHALGVIPHLHGLSARHTSPLRERLG